jgi:F-type H+/Na+-transporting ATPase subunit alpha
MKQNQYSPLSVAQMAMSLFAANEGYLDKVEVNKVLAFEAALHAYMKSQHAALMDKINSTGDFDDAIKADMVKALDSFTKTQSW